MGQIVSAGATVHAPQFFTRPPTEDFNQLDAGIAAMRQLGREMLDEPKPDVLIVIGSDLFGDMIKSNPEIAVRMLRKYSLRLRETTKQIEQMASAVSAGEVPKSVTAPVVKVASTANTLQTEAVAYFISIATGNVFPVFKTDSLLGRYDSVTGMTPEIDLSNEDQSRNISRRHARLVIKDGHFYIAEEIGTMNGTFLNGQKLPNGVLTPIKDGDELVLCRLGITFKTPSPGK
jgi:hypothetical protein